MSEEDSQVTNIRAHIFKGATSTTGILHSILNPGGESEHPYEYTPLPPDKLNAMVEMSSHLRPAIDSYVTNVHSKGHTLAPVVKFDEADAVVRVRDSMLAERLVALRDSDKDITSVSEVTDAEIEAKLRALQLRAKEQNARASAFFSNCNPEGSFTDLRERTAHDLEATGNAYWEVLRDSKGRPRNLIRVRSASMRIGNCVDKTVETNEYKYFTELFWRKVKVNRTFKKFVEIDRSGQPLVWFKEFGDPRTMSRDSGTYYSNIEEFLKKEPKGKEASEVFHFSIHSSSDTPYGVPRWSGNVPGVLGSRELDETNLDYFASNAVPALALLVSGGRFGKNVEERLKEFFNEDVKGRKSTHRLVVLEAESPKTGSTLPTTVPKIELKPLRSAQQQDALFQEYDKSNEVKIRGSFRLPASIVGKAKFSLLELKYAEDQVFQALRDDFDEVINRHFLPELGIHLWRFRTNASIMRDASVVSDLVLKGVKEGIIVPDEAREIISKLIQFELPKKNTIWSSQPVPCTLAILGIKAGPAAAVAEQGRQEGNPAPVEALLAELGLDSDMLGEDVRDKLIERLNSTGNENE